MWAHDFMMDRTHDGKAFRRMPVIDEFTREGLAIRVGSKMNSNDVLPFLADLFLLRGIPKHIRSDNGPELCAKGVREWLSRLGVKTLFIEPGSPWENGYNESFNGKLRREGFPNKIRVDRSGGAGHSVAGRGGNYRPKLLLLFHDELYDRVCCFQHLDP